MEAYIIISILCSIAYLFLGVHVFTVEPDAKLNRAFLVVCFLFAWWAITYSYIFMADSVEGVWTWYKLSSIGWCNFAGVVLHITLIMTGLERRFSKWWLYPALYLPGIASTAIVFSPLNLVASGFTRINGIWFEVSNKGPLGYLFPVYYSMFIALALIIILIWSQRTSIKREKKQGRIFFIGILLTLLPGVFINNIFPLMDIYAVPAISYYFGLIWLTGVTYSIRKYKFLTINSSLAADTILGRIRDSVFLTDQDGRIIKANRESMNLFGYSESEMRDMPVTSLAEDQEAMADHFERMKQRDTATEGADIPFKTSAGEIIPLNISGASIRDGIGDVLGVVVAGFDLRPRKRLESLNRELSTANRELEEAQRIAQLDMAMAINVQADLFPSSPPVLDDWEVAFHFEPAAGISGDMYDFYIVDGELKGVSLFDVTGHGISSGLITILAKSIIARNFHRHLRLKLSDVMERINRELIIDIGGVDHYLGGIVLRFQGDTVEYANAGHHDLLYKKYPGSRVVPVRHKDREGKGFFLGLDRVDYTYDFLKFKIFSGDMLFLYSDGLVECLNESGECFGADRLNQTLLAAPDTSAEEAVNYIHRTYKSFIGDRKPADDLTFMAVRRK